MSRFPRTVALAVVSSVFALVWAATPYVNAQATSHDASMANRLPASALARLRAAGLDPASADFQENVRHRLRSPFAAAARLQIPKQFTEKVNTYNGPQLRASSTNLFNEYNRNSQNARSKIREVPFVLEKLVDSYESGAGKIAFAFLTSNITTPHSGSADVVWSFPECGVTVHNVGSIHDDADQKFVVSFPSDDSEPLLPIGATRRAGTLTIRVNGQTSNDLPVTAIGRYAPVQLPPLAIGYAAPYISDPNPLGITRANATFAQPGLERVNLGATEISGDDYLAQNIAMGKQYALKASIVAAHSISDIGNDSPDNAYRGASIRSQPSSNRLETVVHWHIAPGESLEYQVTWSGAGPAGQRPIASMPKSGPCDS